MKRKKVYREFKLNAVSLLLDKGYTYREAQAVAGASNGALGNWVRQVQEEDQGKTPVGAKAITGEQQKVQELEARIKQLEVEKEVLKKVTALLMTDNNQFSR